VGNICHLDIEVHEVSNIYSVKRVYEKLMEAITSMFNLSWSKACIDQSCQKYHVQCEDWFNFLSNLTRNNLF